MQVVRGTLLVVLTLVGLAVCVPIVILLFPAILQGAASGASIGVAAVVIALALAVVSVIKRDRAQRGPSTQVLAEQLRRNQSSSQPAKAALGDTTNASLEVADADVGIEYLASDNPDCEGNPKIFGLMHLQSDVRLFPSGTQWVRFCKGCYDTEKLHRAKRDVKSPAWASLKVYNPLDGVPKADPRAISRTLSPKAAAIAARAAALTITKDQRTVLDSFAITGEMDAAGEEAFKIMCAGHGLSVDKGLQALRNAKAKSSAAMIK